MEIKDLSTKLRESRVLFAFGLGGLYLNGILNINRFLPINKDLNIALLSAIILLAGLLLDSLLHAWNNKKDNLAPNFYIGAISLSWIYLFFIILIQPLLNKIIYVDNLIFPLGSILLAFIITTQVNSIKDKNTFTFCIVIFLIIGGLLHSFTQFSQLLNLQSFYGKLVMPIAQGERPVGNVAQPNQATYIYALAISALAYLNYLIIDKKNHKYYVLQQTIIYIFIAIMMLAIGISGSRGGIILGFVSLILLWIITHLALRIKIFYICIYSVIGVISFLLGNELLGKYSQYFTAVEKITQGVAPFRWYQLQQAWMLFSEKPLIGVGFGNYAYEVNQRAFYLPWFTYADHSHMLISQIASELGVLGLLILIPLAYVIYKNIGFNYSPTVALPIAAVAITLLYSFSEYPLWYFIYFIMFATFLGLIDIKLKFTFKSSSIIIIIITLMLIASVYYYIQYNRYLNSVDKLLNTRESSLVDEDKVLKDIKPVFGFMPYYDIIIYSMVPTDQQNLNAKIILGYRVIRQYPTSQIQEQQAILLLQVGKPKEALELIKTVCLFDFAKDCNDLDRKIYMMTYSQKVNFESLYVPFRKWREANYNKTGLNDKLVEEAKKNLKPKK